MTVVIGIDPGPTNSALVAYRPEKPHIFSAMYLDNTERTNKDRGSLPYEAAHLAESLTRDNDAVVVIEYPQNYGQVTGASTLDTVYAIGVMTRQMKSLGVREIYGLSRPTIKRVILGQSKGTDADVARVLRDVVPDLSLVHNVKNGGHKRAALAVAFAASVAMRDGDWSGWLDDTQTRRARRLVA